jgi:serine/threonine protein kinase
MTLTTGTRVGPYEVVSPLGAGGMGEVYLGTDTRLGRPRYHAYYLTVAGAMGRETPARIVAAGQSLDTMERVSGKWLLKTRDVAAKD